MENNPSSSSTDRKLIERNRRNQMKALYSELNSVVPHDSSREANSVPDQIGEATKYIKNLQIKLEKMNEKKKNLIEITERSKNVGLLDRGGRVLGLKYPQLKIQQTGSSLDVVLITGLDHQFLFIETIRALQEEGSDIVNANYTVLDNAVLHTIHCQVGESVNAAVMRVSEKLNKFLYH